MLQCTDIGKPFLAKKQKTDAAALSRGVMVQIT